MNADVPATSPFVKPKYGMSFVGLDPEGRTFEASGPWSAMSATSKVLSVSSVPAGKGLRVHSTSFSRVGAFTPTMEAGRALRGAARGAGVPPRPPRGRGWLG